MRDSSRCLRTAGAGFVLLALSAAAQAEDGYRLWLRYDPLPAPLRQQYAGEATEIFVEPKGPTATIAATELERGLSGLLGSPVQIQPTLERDGAVVLALANSPDVELLHLGTAGLGREGFLLKAARVHGRHVTLVVANSDNGLLYGAFALLRRIETHETLERIDIRDAPTLPLRLLNHWDNLDRTVERGYAGLSIWDWPTLPQRIDARYVDYARANASIGINGTVLNNVNADPRIVTAEYLRKVAALADLFRAYGIQGLSVGALQQSHRDRRIENSRPARSRDSGMVEGEGRRNLSPHS